MRTIECKTVGRKNTIDFYLMLENKIIDSFSLFRNCFLTDYNINRIIKSLNTEYNFSDEEKTQIKSEYKKVFGIIK